MNNFEQASRLKLRFDLNGQISVEQLWDVKEEVLIQYEERLEATVEKYGKSKRSSGRKTTAQQLDELRLALVTSILDTRIAEREAEAAKIEAKKHNQKIMEILAQRQEDALGKLSDEELKALLK